MARFKTFSNGGSLLPGDLNSIEDDHDIAFSSYKTILEARPTVIGSSAAAGTYPLGSQEAAMTAASDGIQARSIFYFDPADHDASAIVARTTKLRVRAFVMTNSTAPGTTFTVGLYPVSAVTGTDPDATLGTVTSGSTVAVATPALSTRNQGNSGDFTAPAAGYYALAVVLAGSTAAVSVTVVRALLQMRQV